MMCVPGCFYFESQAGKKINLLRQRSKLYIKRILSAPSVVEISGIEPLTCAALTPPIRQRRIYYIARGLRFVFTAQQSKKRGLLSSFFVVEISGIEPLTS